MEEKIIVIFNAPKKNICVDLEIPTDITARDLVRSLNEAYNLGIDTDDIKKCHLQMENPIGLLRGNLVIADSGIRNGSVISYTE